MTHETLAETDKLYDYYLVLNNIFVFYFFTHVPSDVCFKLTVLREMVINVRHYIIGALKIYCFKCQFKSTCWIGKYDKKRIWQKATVVNEWKTWLRPCQVLFWCFVKSNYVKRKPYTYWCVVGGEVITYQVQVGGWFSRGFFFLNGMLLLLLSTVPKSL